MKRSSKWLITIFLVLVLAAVAVGLVWHMNHYKMVDFRFYPKDAVTLDLRGEEVSLSHYNKLHRQLPDCRILWNVPFQEGVYPSDTKSLTINSLTEEDMDRLAYFPDLETLHAEGCQEYARLLTLAQRYPQVALFYTVTMEGVDYAQDADFVRLDAVSEEDLALLPALPRLTTVVAGGGTPENLDKLQSYCHEKQIDFCVALGDSVLMENTETIRAEGVTEGELALLERMPALKQVHLIDPQVPAQALLDFRDGRPELELTWEVDVFGVTYDDSVEELDLSDASLPSLEEVEKTLAYFPKVKEVFLGEPGFDNEDIAAYRERVREDYKVVWVVDLSGRMKVRTDIDNFMPSRDGWGYVRDGEVDNIRYCEDLICIDLGHMGIKNVDFLEPLVNLEYLILAHTEVQYIDAISNCKKLKYLELDWSPIKDLAPLAQCTALEDLNIGMAWPDVTGILEMTWLKNVYIIKGSGSSAWKISQALPNTRVVASGEYTVSSGWRNLPNYYKMRDILGMYYM